MYEELLKLAKQTLESQFNDKEVKVSLEVKKKYSKKNACFVTLMKKGELRGCVGSLEARQELWKEVIDNAINAGFNDYRFFPLTKEELDKIKIEISVLSGLEKLKYKSSEDLFRKIDRNMGIILKKSGRSATFLPRVWEQIPDKKEFLERLSLKAGLDKDAWKTAEIEFYKVEVVEED